MGRVRYTPIRDLKEAVFAKKLLGILGRDQVQMGRVRYTPSFVFQEVVLVRPASDGQSQIHTTPCLEGSRVGEENLTRDRHQIGKVRYYYHIPLVVS
jgi:hypothetical protein